jgi:hypothetical protein
VDGSDKLKVKPDLGLTTLTTSGLCKGNTMEAETKLTIGDYYFQISGTELHLYEGSDNRLHRWT